MVSFTRSSPGHAWRIQNSRNLKPKKIWLWELKPCSGPKAYSSMNLNTAGNIKTLCSIHSFRHHISSLWRWGMVRTVLTVRQIAWPCSLLWSPERGLRGERLLWDPSVTPLLSISPWEPVPGIQGLLGTPSWSWRILLLSIWNLRW